MANWNPNLTISASATLFVLWNYRKGRWSLFFQALEGRKVISGSRVDASPNAPASTSAPSAPTGGTVGNTTTQSGTQYLPGATIPWIANWSPGPLNIGPSSYGFNVPGFSHQQLNELSQTAGLKSLPSSWTRQGLLNAINKALGK